MTDKSMQERFNSIIKEISMLTNTFYSTQKDNRKLNIAIQELYLACKHTCAAAECIGLDSNAKLKEKIQYSTDWDAYERELVREIEDKKCQ